MALTSASHGFCFVNKTSATFGCFRVEFSQSASTITATCDVFPPRAPVGLKGSAFVPGNLLSGGEHFSCLQIGSNLEVEVLWMMTDSSIFGMHMTNVYIRRPVLRDISDSPLGRGMQLDVDVGVGVKLGAPVKCRFADVRIFEVVKCGEILLILSADVMGKMRMWQCGYATNEHMPVAQGRGQELTEGVFLLFFPPLPPLLSFFLSPSPFPDIPTPSIPPIPCPSSRSPPLLSRPFPFPLEVGPLNQLGA